MSAVQVSKLSNQEKAELACTYAALILHDDEQQITGQKIAKLVSAAGIKVEAYWPKLFAKALQGKDVSSFFNFGGSAAGPAAPAAPAAENKAADKPKKEEKKKEAPPPPKEEEQEMDMGDLFG